MNKSPLNYLITLAIGCIVWVITGLVLATYLSNTISLASLEVEEFLVWFRIAITVTGVISLLKVYYWFYYGNKDTTAGNLDSAKKVWYILFVSQTVLAVLILFIKVIAFLNEGIALIDYLIMFGALSLHTYIFFWLCTFMMSPRAVKYLVPLKK